MIQLYPISLKENEMETQTGFSEAATHLEALQKGCTPIPPLDGNVALGFFLVLYHSLSELGI